MKTPLRLLLVEDSEDDAELLLAILQGGPYEISSQRVETEEAMRKALGTEKWDLVISDYSMPSFDGPAAIRILRDSNCGIPIIIVSGAIGEDLAVETLKMGADDYLLKHNLTRLVPAVERALEMAAVSRQHQELERMQTLIMTNSLDLICSLDARGCFIEVSAAASSISGYSPDELIGRPLEDFVHEDDRERTRCMLEKVHRGSATKNFINYCLHRSGEPVRMMWSAVWSPSDAVMILVGRDVTELKRREERLRLRESALAHVSQAVLISDQHRIISYANPSFTEITGYTENDVLGRNCSFLQGPDTDAATIEKMREALNTGQHFEGEILNYRKNGEPFWNELSIAPIINDDEPLRFIGILRDVTERRRIEADLRKETAFFEAQVESSLDGILVVNTEGRQILQNRRMQELWNFPSSLARSDHDSEQLEFAAGQTKNPEQFAARVADLMSHPEEISREEIELLDGTILDRYSAPVRDDANQYYGRIWSFRDVTADRAREEKLAQALELEKTLTEKALSGDRAKSEFLAVMSHEVRTPLNAILGFAGLLADTPHLPEKSHDHAQTIMESGEALLRILDDILDFSRLEANRLAIETASFSPRKLLTDICTLFKQSATGKPIDFSTSISPSVPDGLVGDEGRLRQILLNLVGNATKFTEVGTIGLSLAPLPEEPSVYIFSVRDTGSGISSDQIDQIFQPFTQADSSISRRYGGAGLGLTISRRLTELMGGTLTVTSELGKGSEFLLTIPLGFSRAKTTESSSPSETWDRHFASSHPLNILLVEDDPTNLKLIRALVRRLGYDPLTAKNGKEAVEISAGQTTDCIVMDLQMPEMDGIEATEKIRAREGTDLKRSTFICALTANIFPADRQRCFDVGMNAYLNKPVKVAALAEKLREAHQFLQTSAS